MSLAGHLLLSLVRGFTLGSAIEFQNGVDTDFPDSLGDGGLLCADGEFPLVFVASEFAFDGYMSPFGEGSGEIGEFPESHASMPLVRDSQDPESFFQDVLVASEKIAMLVALLAFRSASLPIKPIRVIRLRYISFSLFCPFVSGTGKRVGAAPTSRSCFSGGTGTGEPEPEGCESKAEASQTPGAAKTPKQCRDNEQDRKRDRTDHHFAGRSRRRNAGIQTRPRYASAVLEVSDGVPRAATARAWGGNATWPSHFTGSERLGGTGGFS